MLFHVAGVYESKMLDAAQSERMLIWQFRSLADAEAPAAMRILPSGKHRSLPSGDAPAAMHIPHRGQDQILKFLAMLKDQADESTDLQNLAIVLFHPVCSRRMRDDAVADHPFQRKESVDKLNNALLLIRQARASAGVSEDSKTLSETQFEKALDKLKSIFREEFIGNQDLRRRVKDWEAEPDAFDRRQKKKIRDDLRGAFRSWATKLLGGWDFKAVMRHGLFATSNQKALAQAVLEDSHRGPGGDTHPAETPSFRRLRENPETLRRAALEARCAYKTAVRLVEKVRAGYAPTNREHSIIMQLESGHLKTMRDEANKAYGHGAGAETLSREQAIVLLAFTEKKLEAYFARAE
jgi:hypothetical protein